MTAVYGFGGCVSVPPPSSVTGVPSIGPVSRTFPGCSGSLAVSCVTMRLSNSRASFGYGKLVAIWPFLPGCSGKPRKRASPPSLASQIA